MHTCLKAAVGGAVVSWLVRVSGLSGLDSSHPGVEMGIGEFNAGGKPCDGLACHPGGVEILFMLQKPG